MYALIAKSTRWLNWSGQSKNIWVFAVFAISLLLAMPLLGVIGLATQSSGDIWEHLVSTTLDRYITTTFLLAAGVSILSLVIGTSTAWLVTMCDFPGKKYFSFVLLLPMAVPSYVIAYAYTDFLDYTGSFQTILREIFRWDTPLDYWFPEVRSLWGAIFLMAFVLYPYVYLLARSSFLEQSVNMLEVSKALGLSPIRSFFYISLPIARPAIVVGLSLVIMETLNDYGTVDFFAIPTLTVALVDVWLGMNNVAGGAQIAASLLIFVFLLIFLERLSRRRQKVYQQTGSRLSNLPNYHLSGFRAIIAVMACSVPVLIGFFLPLSVLGLLAYQYFEISWNAEFRSLAFNSFSLSLASSVLIILVALFLAYSWRVYGNPTLRLFIKVGSMGYAMPGAVLALGILIPFAALDNWVDSLSREYFGLSTGLIFSGSLWAIIFAYLVRFLTVAMGQIQSSLEKISPSMDMAAKSLGYSDRRILATNHIPLLKAGIFVSLIIVFVDCMKELPATLILRPFNFDTLAIHVYQFASDEMLGEAALGCLFIVTTGLLPVVFLSAMLAKSRTLRLEHKRL